MKQPLIIIKVGGKVVEDPASLSALLARFATIEGRKVLVHGGGRTATHIATLLGIETTMIEGRRVTDERMLRVVTMVYGGLVNKNVVAQLGARGVCAIGMTGADCALIRAHRRPANPVDYGFVGDVDSVDAARLAPLVEQGIVPVVAPLSFDPATGTLLNTNADTIAASVAKAMAETYAVTLVYCFEKPGVLARADDDTSVIPEIHAADFARLKDEGTVSGGMIPKLQNALDAVAAGVERVVITSAPAIDLARGTQILP